MNRIISIILIILLVTLCSCNMINTENETTTDTGEETTTDAGEVNKNPAKETAWYESIMSAKGENACMPNGKMMELFSKVENVPLNLLQKQEHSKGLGIIKNVRARNFSAFDQLSSTMGSLEQFCSVYTTEHIKKIDDEHICVIYSISIDEIGDALMYVIFEKSIQNDSFEKWETTGEHYILSQKRSSADFAEIKIGDTVADILKFDVGMHIEIAPGNSYSSKSYRLLEDGLLIITFDISKDNIAAFENFGSVCIKNVQFYPWGSEEIPDNVSIINSPHLLDGLE